MKYLKLLLKLIPRKKSSVGTTIVTIVLFVVIYLLKSSNEELQNEIESLIPDTVYVQGETTIDTLVDTVKVIKPSPVKYVPKREIVVDTIVKKDTLIINRTVTDTIYRVITKRTEGVISFSDSSNELVSVDGLVDYPEGKNIQLVYRTKRWKKYERFSLIPRIGLTRSLSSFEPSVGLGVTLKKVFITLDFADNSSTLSFGYKVF